LEPEPFDKLGFYHCDHLGTPQEITDEEGNIAWQAQYKAWGEAKEIISKAAQGAGFKNPLRFQGQYFDHETGLYYNRFRYYDPETGRFISKDPIKYAGGLNLHVYALNPIGWIDPWGLRGNPATATHITYRGIDAETGKPYVGYASMQGKHSGQEVLDYRYSGNYDKRFGGKPPEVLYADYGEQAKYTARGLEQRQFEKDGGRDGTANQNNPVGERNTKRDDYLIAADKHLKQQRSGGNKARC
jgi:RHS repeat-associated protein